MAIEGWLMRVENEHVRWGKDKLISSLNAVDEMDKVLTVDVRNYARKTQA